MASRPCLPELRDAHGFVPSRAEEILAVLPTDVSPPDLLALLEHHPWKERGDLIGSANIEGGSASGLGRFFEIGGRFLKTSLDRRFPDRATALQEEEQEHIRRSLGVYDPRRIWFLSRGPQGEVWAGSLSPTLRILRTLLNEDPAAEAPWLIFLRCVEMTLKTARRSQATLDCNPNNFGLAEERLYYVDDDLHGPPALISQILLRLREYPSTPLHIKESFLRRSCQLLSGCSRPLAGRFGLLADLENPTFWPREQALRGLLRELQRRLENVASAPIGRLLSGDP